MQQVPNTKYPVTRSRNGQLSLQLLIFTTVTVMLLGGFGLWAGSFLNLSLRGFNNVTAFSIAEAGVEYYRWHLAHVPTDYWDGQGASSTGPYVHDYYNKSGEVVGKFSLDITPPPAGSTVVTIRSTGTVVGDSTIKKVIQVKMGIPSFAKYAWAEGSSDSFGTAAEVFGPIYINGGLHFDGIAHNFVQSTFTNYNHNGESPSGNEWGVHTNRGQDDPAYPTALPDRPDVFMAGRAVGSPALDFDAMAQDLFAVKEAASSSGTYFASSGASGWDLYLNASGTFNVYKVTATSTKGSCNYERWTVQTSTFYASGTIPNNGNIFFEDNLWVSGKIDGKRVTIGAARFPDDAAKRKNITVNKDLLYTKYDCSETVALIAQNNLNIGYSSESDLRIDAALVAQNGSIGRDSYSGGSCGASSTRSVLTMYGTFVNKLIRGLSTYATRTYIYDNNLLYCPPPSFPLTGDQYTQISWEEVE